MSIPRKKETRKMNLQDSLQSEEGGSQPPQLPHDQILLSVITSYS